MAKNVENVMQGEGIGRKTAGKEVLTTEKYWDCECEKNFIHPKSQSGCGKCGSAPDQQPYSREDEVLRFGLSL